MYAKFHYMNALEATTNALAEPGLPEYKLDDWSDEELRAEIERLIQVTSHGVVLPLSPVDAKNTRRLLEFQAEEFSRWTRGGGRGIFVPYTPLMIVRCPKAVDYISVSFTVSKEGAQLNQ